MLLYHGTSWYAAKKILEQRLILTSKKENSPYNGAGLNLETTAGYVYLTNKENKAKTFGNKAVIIPLELLKNDKTIVNEDWQWCCVFEVSIKEKDLEIDIDECNERRSSRFLPRRIEPCKFCSLDACLEKINCLRSPRDLVLGKDVTRYKIYTVKDALNGEEEVPVVVSDWKVI